jgi:Ca2+-dependent lipid-binding protein
MAQVEVTVIEATNLKQNDKLKKNDCYIRIHLNDQKRKTTTIKNSNDPQWNEIFVLYVDLLFLFYLFCFNSVIM